MLPGRRICPSCYIFQIDLLLLGRFIGELAQQMGNTIKPRLFLFVWRTKTAELVFMAVAIVIAFSIAMLVI